MKRYAVKLCIESPGGGYVPLADSEAFVVETGEVMARETRGNTWRRVGDVPSARMPHLTKHSRERPPVAHG